MCGLVPDKNGRQEDVCGLGVSLKGFWLGRMSGDVGRAQVFEQSDQPISLISHDYERGIIPSRPRTEAGF